MIDPLELDVLGLDPAKRSSSALASRPSPRPGRPAAHQEEGEVRVDRDRPRQRGTREADCAVEDPLRIREAAWRGGVDVGGRPEGEVTAE